MRNDIRAIMVQSHKDAKTISQAYHSSYAKAHRIGLKRAWAASRVSKAPEERALGWTILAAALTLVLWTMLFATGAEALAFPALVSFCGTLYGAVCTWMAIDDRKVEASYRAICAELKELDTLF